METFNKPTMEKSQINEINETLHPTLHPLMQEVYGDIWKPTIEKSHISAANVTMPALIQVI